MVPSLLAAFSAPTAVSVVPRVLASSAVMACAANAPVAAISAATMRLGFNMNLP
jgi:hypothetical protein